MTPPAPVPATGPSADTVSRMPALFVGHGSPMNAIDENRFSRTWEEMGQRLRRPTAVLCVSAHWLTQGSVRITTSGHPETIHDFYGFPDELYRRRYPAPGAPGCAEFTRRLVASPAIQSDPSRGLDHGAWSVLGRMYPDADVPVFELSIDFDQPPEYHYAVGQRLRPLRDRGVLILGSGNLVHNLGAARPGSAPYRWAEEFDGWLAGRLEAGEDAAVVGFQDLGRLAELAHPTIDHFLPLLYVLGARSPEDRLEFFATGFDLGSVSMRSVLFEPGTG